MNGRLLARGAEWMQAGGGHGSGKRVEVCRAEQVAVGSALRVSVDGHDFAVFHLEDGFYVTDDGCTHGPGCLSEGTIEEGQVACPVHGGIFDIRTGNVVEPPCTVAVRTYRAEVELGLVFVIL